MLEKDKAKAPLGALLVVDQLDRATDYYFNAFGAIETERYADPSGKVWYAVIHILGTPVQLMEPVPEMGMVAADGRRSRLLRHGQPRIPHRPRQGDGADGASLRDPRHAAAGRRSPGNARGLRDLA